VLRGEVYQTRLDPVEGSEPGGTRPVIVMSRNSINVSSSVIIAVPCTTYRRQRIYPSQVLVRTPEGGLTADSLVKTDQISALSKTRLIQRLGMVTPDTLTAIENAILKALDIQRP